MVSADVISQEKLAELEAKHGRVGVVSHADGKSWVVVLRKPRRAEYKMFKAHLTEPRRAADAQENLVKQTCVFPDAPTLEALLDEWPGIPDACGNTIIALSGMAGVEQGKA